MIWKNLARKEQLMPKGDWKNWIIMAGRGFGKTRAGAEAVLELISSNKVKRVGILGETLFEAEQLMLTGPSGILTHSPMKYKFIKSQKKIIFENKVECFFFGADKYNKLRGFEFDLIWVDELAKFPHGKEVVEQTDFCLRVGLSKMIITTTPQNKPFLKDFLNRPKTILTEGSSFDNKNLSSDFFDNLDNYSETSFGQQEIHGKINNSFLWTVDDIVYEQPKNIKDYCIGIDPAVENGTTGIIVSGIDGDHKIHVLDDYSMKSVYPNDWIMRLRNATFKYPDAMIAVEINQGGQLLDELLQLFQIPIPYVRYRAHENKKKRQGIAYLMYRKSMITHRTSLVELEKEMLEFPKDRVDALYWTFHHFMKSYRIQLEF